MEADQQRRARIDEALEAAGADALLLRRPDELVMALGHLPSWGRSMAVMPRGGDALLLVPALEPEDVLPSEGVVVRRYGWGVAADPWAELAAQAREGLSSILPRGARILWGLDEEGAPSLPAYSAEIPGFPARLAEEAASAAGCALLRGDAAVLALFQRKTKAEAERLRFVHECASKAVEAFEQALAPGVREVEAAAAAESAVAVLVDGVRIRTARAWAFVQSGPNTMDSGRVSRSGARRMHAGEPVLMEICVCVDGYHADLTRTEFVPGGEPDARAMAMREWVREAQAAAIAAMRPGARCAQIDAAARDFLAFRKPAEWFPHATGHHTGFRYHDPGPVLAPGSEGLLEEGMVLTVEPGLYHADAGCGVRLEENVLVGPKDAEVLGGGASRAVQP